MKTTHRAFLSVLCGLCAGTFCSAGALELKPALFEGHGAGAALAALPDDPVSPEAVFAHSAVEMLAAVEDLGRDFYAQGLRFDAGRSLPLPFLRMAVPVNPAPKPTKPEDVRRILETFHARLAAIDARLATIEGREFKAVIPLGAAGFDFKGTGKPEDRVSFGPFFARMASRGAERDASATADFVVAFDQTDALWLRAYTNLLRGLADVWLAHDGGELFAATGHLYFAKAETDFARLLAARGEKEPRGDYGSIADIIATIHGIDLPVADSARLARARTELLEMTRLSRATLASAAAETDDDREWLPSPTQNSVFNLRLDEAQTKSWTGVLDELEALLEGKKLLPHWRFPREGYGLNLRRLFEESRRTDLIGYIQGAAATPYLEEGPTTSAATWRELMRVFGGNFLGYALWIN